MEISHTLSIIMKNSPLILLWDHALDLKRVTDKFIKYYNRNIISCKRFVSGCVILNMKRATALLTSFERQKNLDRIITNLREQTEAIDIFLWNNCAEDKTEYPVDLQINSSKNLMCWPRWFMANYATTDYVFSLDDDLIFTDNHVIRDAINYLDSNDCSAIGYSGVRIINNLKDYSDQQHIFYPRQDQSVDIIKGGFIFTKKQSIVIPQNLINTCIENPRVEDDIIISSFLSKKVIPGFIRRRLRVQNGFHSGLHSQTSHTQSRTQYMRKYYE